MYPERIQRLADLDRIDGEESETARIALVKLSFCSNY